MIIFAISGKAESGKDTLAESLQKVLPKGTEIYAFGDAVKEACLRSGWDGIKDEKGRQFLQDVGSAAREYNKDVWCHTLLSDMNESAAEHAIISDCRYPNEIEYLKSIPNFTVITVRIERPNHINKLTEAQKMHESETALDNYQFDYIIYNEGKEFVSTGGEVVG